VGVSLTQPAVDVEVVALLRPQHAGQCLAHDRLGIVAQRGRRDRVVELVPLRPPLRDHVGGVGKRLRKAVGALAGEPHVDRGRPAGGNLQTDVGGGLGPLAVRAHGVGAVDEMVADAVLGVGRSVVAAPQSPRVGLVVAQQQRGAGLGMQVEHPELGVLGSEHRMVGLDARDPGLGIAGRPRPRVSKPQRGQHVQRRVV
jgi:hypothetical protein